MNRTDAIKWGEENLTPNQLRNFKNSLYEADSYMTQDAYDFNNYFSLVFRDCHNSQEAQKLDDDYHQKSKAIDEQIKALREEASKLSEEHEKTRETLVSDLYQKRTESEDFKTAKEKSEKVWVGINAIRANKIEEVVAKYQKRVKASA